MKFKNIIFFSLIILSIFFSYSFTQKPRVQHLARNQETHSGQNAKQTEQINLKDYKIDQIFVEKSKRLLHLKSAGKLIKSYSISLGDAPKGPKIEQGDERTPEGFYIIDWRNPKSSYHLSLHVSYPKVWQKAHARIRGVNPGGDIMIHGLPKGQESWGKAHLFVDWTDGCIALTNEEIEEIWKAVPNGTEIFIAP